jgi:CRISPR-associated protein Csm1
VDIGARLPGSAGALITYRSSHFPIPHVRPLKAGEVEEALASLGEGQMLYSFSLNPGLPLPVKPLENYIPQVGRDGSEREMAELIRECYEEGPELREGLPKNFCHIALHALERRGSSLCGRPYLGVLKADVDNLGYIFSRGFIKVNGSSILSLSRLVSLSWFLDLFFSEVLKSYVEEEERFRNIYSVFSGGDDLFLIGPWSRILEFEPLLREKFSEYTCENRSFTISAGIAVVRPELPIYYMAEEAEGALDVSKEGGKNATTVFSKRIAYPEFSLKELLEVADWLTGKIGGWCDGEGAQKGSGSLLYKLLTISEMANREGEEPRNMLWRAYLKYLIYRRSGSSEEERKEAQELFKELERLIRKYSEEISEGGGRKKDNLFYIPLAIAIYRRRKYGKGEN